MVKSFHPWSGMLYRSWVKQVLPDKVQSVPCPPNLNVPLVPPVSRKDISDRITPKTSVCSSVCTLPVFGSGRTSSKLLPLDSRISCCLVPAKQPWTAWVMPVARCRIKLYKYIALRSRVPPLWPAGWCLHFSQVHKNTFSQGLRFLLLLTWQSFPLQSSHLEVKKQNVGFEVRIWRIEKFNF